MNVKEFQESTKFNKFYINWQNMTKSNKIAKCKSSRSLSKCFRLVLFSFNKMVAFGVSIFLFSLGCHIYLRSQKGINSFSCPLLTWNKQCLRSYYEPKILRNVPSVSCFRFSDYHFISFIPSFIWTPEPWNEIEVSWQCSSWLLFTWIS